MTPPRSTHDGHDIDRVKCSNFIYNNIQFKFPALVNHKRNVISKYVNEIKFVPILSILNHLYFDRPQSPLSTATGSKAPVSVVATLS